MNSAKNKSRMQSKWSDDCPWPRRLLHVASMISYTWSPGNKYGPHKEPRYNAVSYTWGRFRYRSNEPEYAKTRPLGVKGVTWPLPRVYPSHFTVEQLHKLLKTATCPEGQGIPVDFVWLDVACIDQTEPHTPEYYSEVGRQSKIFRGATDVVVWLTKTDSKQMTQWWTKMSSIKAPVKEVLVGGWENYDVDGWLSQVLVEFQQLRSDPWFTSLWTLQEAFLCPMAIILLSDSQSFFNCVNDIPSGGYLSHLITLCQGMYNFLNQLQRSVSRKATFSQAMLDAVKAEIETFGFLEGFNQGTNLLRMLELGFSAESPWMGNPLMLLQASHRRTCYEKTDRVRGIMQVFQLRLGESSPNHIPGKTYSLSELEDQLASELLRMYPISSQLFIQDRACPPRRAWRINANMTMMRFSELLWRQMTTLDGSSASERKIVTRSKGATLDSATFEGVLMARFRGNFSKMSTFVQVMEKCIGFDTMELELEHKYKDAIQEVFPGTIVSRSQEFAWLAGQSQGRNMGTLFLARVGPPPNAPRLDNVWCSWCIGLVLCQEAGRRDVFEKIGVVTWDLEAIRGAGQDRRVQSTDEVADAAKYIVGEGTGWTPLSGYFG
ncbi:HET domain-containing protein [Fusarium keratoplasticum]|uniref:HET domain-containing protein n=1 Tax=Fusarium keratoplasticum TaxID=1328300 RepID=A0ACC0QL88_9HYPO|nr:HET domain-containing protein [Fusarium keratoplasticum]KAI8658072.1 HET domain-containing protein [Fusarium keratoplasticum]KAI8659037.1 HET domain-containing protein [Fusarium keratoplasticum]